MKFDLSRATNSISQQLTKVTANFTAREKLLLLVAAVILIPLLIFRLTLFPLWEFQGELQRQKHNLQSEIQQIQVQGRLYRKTRGNRQAQGQALSARVNRILTSLSLASLAEQSSRSINKGEGVSLRLQNITLFDVTSLISRLEKIQPKITIVSMDMQASSSNAEMLQITILLSSGGL